MLVIKDDLISVFVVLAFINSKPQKPIAFSENHFILTETKRIMKEIDNSDCPPYCSHIKTKSCNLYNYRILHSIKVTPPGLYGYYGLQTKVNDFKIEVAP